MKCSQCGTCCKLFLINLTKEEYFSRKYKTQFKELTKDFEEAELCGANILAQKKDNSCIYLKNNKCSIHSIRPVSCRNFFCDSKEPNFQGMIKEINKNKS